MFWYRLTCLIFLLGSLMCLVSWRVDDWLDGLGWSHLHDWWLVGCQPGLSSLHDLSSSWLDFFTQVRQRAAIRATSNKQVLFMPLLKFCLLMSIGQSNSQRLDRPHSVCKGTNRVWIICGCFLLLSIYPSIHSSIYCSWTIKSKRQISFWFTHMYKSWNRQAVSASVALPFPPCRLYLKV